MAAAAVYPDVLPPQLEAMDGKKVEGGAALKGKVVVLFFSAEWCPACTSFVPTLKTLYEEAEENNVPLEVVYVSSDRDETQMKRYMSKKHGPWLSVPYDSTAFRDKLKQIHVYKPDFSVIGLPPIHTVDGNKADRWAIEGSCQMAQRGKSQLMF